MRYIGTKFSGHDSAVWVVDTEKESIFAISTERVTRIKHDSMDVSPILKAYDLKGFASVGHCYSDFSDESGDGELRAKMVHTKTLEKIVRRAIEPEFIKDLNLGKSERKRALMKYFRRYPSQAFFYYITKFKRASCRNDSSRNFLAHKENIKSIFFKYGIKVKGEPRFYDHHLCHAIPAYAFSGINGEALVLTLDGQGDGYWSKLFKFDDLADYHLIGGSEALQIDGRGAATSLGRLYGYFTRAMGLIPDSDEGKVEAYAAFADADATFLRELHEMVSVNPDDLSMNFDINKSKLIFDLSYLEQKRKQLGDAVFCAVIQRFLEEIVVAYVRTAIEKTGIKKLCLSGGVAANIIMSMRIFEEAGIEYLYVLPPMGDDGLALGSSILLALEDDADLSWLKKIQMPYFGDQYEKQQVKSELESVKGISFKFLGEDWPIVAAQSVHEGKVCALFHGRMEFGPRALGNRSIVASPMRKEMQEHLNKDIKRRPWYQPFCPSILEEERERLFVQSFPHKHMAIAFRMREEFRMDLPCAVHIDGTARPQFVEINDNQQYFRFLEELKRLSGYGVCLNTSFNMHGRTIVRTPKDALRDFLDCGIDELFIEGYQVKKG